MSKKIHLGFIWCRLNYLIITSSPGVEIVKLIITMTKNTAIKGPSALQDDVHKPVVAVALCSCHPGIH